MTPYPFRKSFLLLFVLGMTGVATIPFALLSLLQSQPMPAGATSLPAPLLGLLSIIQPALLLAAAVAAGLLLAPRLALRSRLLDRFAAGRTRMDGWRAEAALALVCGIALAALMLLLDDLIFKPALPAFFESAGRLQPATLGKTVMGVLYGGITEELLMRWGVMSLCAWIGWRLFQSGAGPLHPALAWGAIMIAALLFAAGHLPAATAFGPLTPMLVARTLLLNAVASAVFGWLFWRRSLEAAMLCHASIHLVFYLATLF